MKLILTLMNKGFIALFILTICGMYPIVSSAQICASPSTKVYGLTSSGGIYPITISTGAVGAAITPAYPGNAPSQANGMGYNSLNGKFYYFKRNANTSPQEFVSFDPAANKYTILTSCPTSNTIHTGCVSADGLGFYTLDVTGRLYYYSITLNTWTRITTVFKNQSGTNITSILAAQSSGDIAIDGNGNLWILTSNDTNYGLYKVSAPLPVLPMASVTATEFVAPTSKTPTNNAFAGIAFNPSGQIILATLSDDKLYRLESNLSLTFLANLSLGGIGNDLTSCSFPLTVLPVSWQSFTASLAGQHAVALSWSIGAEQSVNGYYIEHSTDGASWNDIGFVPAAGVNGQRYSFTHTNAAGGNHYYRIREADQGGQTSYSDTKTIAVGGSNTVAVWPNPARDAIQIQSSHDEPGAMAWVFDQSGRAVYNGVLQAGANRVALNGLPTGMYVVRVQSTNGETFTQKIVKQ